MACVECTTFMPLRRRDGSVRAWTRLDSEDYERFKRWSWRLISPDRAGGGYAGRNKRIDGSWQTLRLHREILGLAFGDSREGDHVNRDTLDNRKANLRVVTHAEQMQNVPGNRGTLSRYRGVSRCNGRWTAQVWADGRLHYLGRFDEEEEAAEVARAFRAEHMPYATD